LFDIFLLSGVNNYKIFLFKKIMTSIKKTLCLLR
jgi:hypothetical protein